MTAVKHSEKDTKGVSTKELRQRFLDYFQQQQHQIVPSSGLIPGNDPTLLFTNAGMVQFKETFLGFEKRAYTRATTAQRCVRAGGKHNDLENVGYTARHHTFFEMLGNFSFGDYFKEDAIFFAWDLLTREFQIPAERLWVTVYASDEEAAKIWLEKMKINPQRFSRIATQDNFWSMGDTGPCGPCTEIFYDHGPEIPGGPPGTPTADGDRYIEIWNLVFMQYNRSKNGEMVPLPKPSVDTGMGLERLSAVMQNVHSNYDIDIFRHLLGDIRQLVDKKNSDQHSLQVIADHIRSTSFLIADGVSPANEGRGYVLRRIMRRAIRHGYEMGLKDPFLYRLVPSLDREMGEAYPELRARRDVVAQTLKQEEEQFARTLEQGMGILEEHIAKLSAKVIPGPVAFLLYDTYGFPVDLTADIARQQGLTVDMTAFESEMEKQRERAQAHSHFKSAVLKGVNIDVQTQFKGYEELQLQARVVALIYQGKQVEHLAENQEGLVFLDQTPFYAESGGQVGDRGRLYHSGGEFSVQDTQTRHSHVGIVKRGSVNLGDQLTGEVDRVWRLSTTCNHSATHLLHAALRQELGDHVTQKGSLVDPKRLRFDFSHHAPLTHEQLMRIESQVNEQIRRNSGVESHLMPLKQALASGAMALFGEKYTEEVRVLKIGDFSTELCGGTHVRRAGDIGFFKILSESGIASGVRRVEAITGEGAVRWILEREKYWLETAALLKSKPDDLQAKIIITLERIKKLEKELEQMRTQFSRSQGDDLLNQVVSISGVQLLAARMERLDAKSLREAMDRLKDKMGSGVIILASCEGDKINLIAGVTQDLITRLQAGPLVNQVAQQVGGKGGGRPDLAQGGGTQPAQLDQALASVATWMQEHLDKKTSTMKK